MGRAAVNRRTDAPKGAPFALAAAADDPRILWCLDVHAPHGRRAFVKPLRDLGEWIDAFDGQPDTVCFLFPLTSRWAERRWASGRHGDGILGRDRRPDAAVSQAREAPDAGVAAMVDRWRRDMEFGAEGCSD